MWPCIHRQIEKQLHNLFMDNRNQSRIFIYIFPYKRVYFYIDSELFCLTARTIEIFIELTVRPLSMATSACLCVGVGKIVAQTNIFYGDLYLYIYVHFSFEKQNNNNDNYISVYSGVHAIQYFPNNNTIQL